MIICHLCPSYVFRPLQDHHQVSIYKGIQEQQTLSKLCVCVELKYNTVN
jgi:hypothetical protein